MATKKLPPLHDIIRLLRPTVSEMVDALERYSQDVGGFNYGYAHRGAALAFSQAVPISDLLVGCSRLKPKAARKPNSEVLRAVYASGMNRSVRTYGVRAKTIRIRRDVEVRVCPTFAFVENEVASLFCLQPRKLFALNLQQLGFYISVFHAAYLIDDFQDVGLELLDLSVPQGLSDRVPTTYRLGDLPVVERRDIEQQFAAFLSAFDQAKMPPRPRRVIQLPRANGQKGIDLKN
jgi:hypothetical protein